jgi:GAF domain-containing protein
MRLHRQAHTVYKAQYHIVWVARFRRKILTPGVATSQAVIAIENVRLFKVLQERNRQITEALEQQTATSEILRVIASSPTDIQPVLDVVAENAARLCDSVDAQIYRVEGDLQRKVASYGMDSSVLGVGETRPLRRRSASGRAILDRQSVHIHDTLSEDQEDYADVWPGVQRLGIRTALAVPLMREAVPIGSITIRRKEVRPFSARSGSWGHWRSGGRKRATLRRGS